jgi:predicted nucleic acid-binding protein
VLSPFVLAEADYLVQRAAGITAELALLGEVSRGVFELAPIGEDDVAAAAAVVDQYADLGLGLTDASLVVLAHRYRIHDVFTLDERHFRVVKSLDGRPFRLLPADA